MSCQLSPFIHLNDIKGLRSFLFPNLKDTEIKDKENQAQGENADGWNDDWDDWNEGKPEEKREITPDSEQEGETSNAVDKWLEECKISVSPAADLIAVGYEDRLVLMTLSLLHQYFVYHLLHKREVPQGAPDWTCVIIGFSSGYIRMFTEAGTLLLSQKLHTEAVQKLKCVTYTPRRYLGLGEQREELLILYLKVLVTIDGFSLYQALKACRNQVARATASGETSLQPPPLAYKKWAPQEIDTIVDCQSAGVDCPRPFDNMLRASLELHTSTIRSLPTVASVYLVSGIGPYLGFYFAVEGISQPILSEVAYAVASKLKSAIISAASGWLRFGFRTKTENAAEKQPKIEPATPLPLKFGLPDQSREGLCVSLSPNNVWAATTDSYGRVILIDLDRGIAVRMWKGYRDAQIGWVEVREDERSSSLHTRLVRSAQFLVIYAARRGILEVWLAGNGPRVAAFNVSRHCQLITISHGVLGLNNVTCRRVRIKAFHVALLDPQGIMKTVQIPFHLALSDKNNKRVRDMHLLKQLKQVLKDHTNETGSLDLKVKDILLNIKIPSIAQQGVERILSTSYLTPKFMIGVLSSYVHRLQVQGERQMNIEKRLFMQYCNLNEKLIQIYLDIVQLKSDTSQNTMNTQEMSSLLGLSNSEMEHIISVVEHCKQAQDKQCSPSRVRFETDSVSHISGFLECFTCTPHVVETDVTQHGMHAITFIKDLTDDKKLLLGTFLFDHCLRQGSASDLGAILIKTGLPMLDIGRLLMYTWLSDNNRDMESVPGFYCLMKIIFSSIEPTNISINKTELLWWEELLDFCIRSTNSQAAYIAAIVSRSVALEISGNSTKLKGQTDPQANDPDADTMSCASETSTVIECDQMFVDLEAWNLLVGQLEDLTYLDCLLELGQKQHQMVPAAEKIVSVSSILEGGKSSITEVVARRIVRLGFKQKDLYGPRQDPESVSACVPTPNEDSVWVKMDMLRKRFPHSIENDVLFSNICWEYTVLWNKKPEELDSLSSAIEFLRLVQNAMLRHGVCSMMWHMFLCKKFHAAAELMEKVGKVPKERICRKEIGLSEMQLHTFLNIICDFLTILMEANCEINEVPVFNIEPLWQNIKGTVALVDLAVDQKMTNYGLLKLNHQLALLMSAVTTFNMKSVKVLSLFDSKGRHALQQQIFAHPLLPTSSVDSSIFEQRKQFLTKVITQSVIKMRELCPPSADTESTSSSSSQNLRLTEPGRWPDIVLMMTESFDIDIEYMKIHYVHELYSAGFDRLAEEVLMTVNDRPSLGMELLSILGQRLAYRLNQQDAKTYAKLISYITPYVSNWIKRQNFKLLIQPDVPVRSILGLAYQTIYQLDEHHQHHELAAALLEFVQAM